MIALAMTMSDKPMAVNMSFQREYAERYEWIKQQFEDIAFSYLTSVIFYEDYDMMQPEQCLLMQQGMEAFGGNAPTYRIALLDKPTIVGFSFADPRRTDDVQLHADGHGENDPPVQALPASLCSQQAQRCILQSAV